MRKIDEILENISKLKASLAEEEDKLIYNLLKYSRIFLEKDSISISGHVITIEQLREIVSFYNDDNAPLSYINGNNCVKLPQAIVDHLGSNGLVFIKLKDGDVLIQTDEKYCEKNCVVS